MKVGKTWMNVHVIKQKLKNKCTYKCRCKVNWGFQLKTSNMVKTIHTFITLHMYPTFAWMSFLSLCSVFFHSRQVLSLPAVRFHRFTYYLQQSSFQLQKQCSIVACPLSCPPDCHVLGGGNGPAEGEAALSGLNCSSVGSNFLLLILIRIL